MQTAARRLYLVKDTPASTAPAWMLKHECTGCSTGYGICTEGLPFDLKCCEDCEHPTRWEEDPWTLGEFLEMWENKDMPPMVQRALIRLAVNEHIAKTKEA